MGQPLRFAMRPLLIGSEIYRGSTYGPKHPLAIPRVSTTLDLIRALGWVTPEQYHESPRAAPEELQRFHSAEKCFAALPPARGVCCWRQG